MRTLDDIHDEWLVLRCQSGDAAAWAELVERWQPRLVRHATRLTGRQDAEKVRMGVTFDRYRRRAGIVPARQPGVKRDD